MPLDSAKLQELLSILTAEVALQEAGARNSKTDLTHIQAIHDASGKLGAACDPKEEMGEAAKPGPDGFRLVESAAAPEILRIAESGESLNPLVKIISAGRGSSGYYSEAVLKRDGPKIFTRGTLMYLNHATDAEEAQRPEGDYTKLAAVTTGDAYWDQNGKDGPALYAPSKVFSGLAAEVREKAPYTGVSIRASGLYAEAATGKPDKRVKFGESKLAPDGKPGLIGQLTRGDSIDLVTRAGRDGKLLLESADSIQKEGADMTDAEKAEQTQLKETAAAQAIEIRRFRERFALTDAAGVIGAYFSTVNVADGIRERVTVRLLSGTVPLTEAGDLDKAKLTGIVEAETKDEAAYIAKLSGGKIVTGMGQASAEITEAQKQEAAKATAEELDRSAGTFGLSTEAGKKIFNEGRKAFDPTYNARLKEVA
jgi:hypothetical protein